MTEVGPGLLEIGCGGVAPGPDLVAVEARHDLAGLHLRIVVGEDLDDLAGELEPTSTVVTGVRVPVARTEAVIRPRSIVAVR